MQKFCASCTTSEQRSGTYQPAQHVRLPRFTVRMAKQPRRWQTSIICCKATSEPRIQDLRTAYASQLGRPDLFFPTHSPAHHHLGPSPSIVHTHQITQIDLQPLCSALLARVTQSAKLGNAALGCPSYAASRQLSQNGCSPTRRPRRICTSSITKKNVAVAPRWDQRVGMEIGPVLQEGG